jgi:hypothetical protein
VAVFASWNKITQIGRKVVAGGLVRRRTAEAVLYRGQVTAPRAFIGDCIALACPLNCDVRAKMGRAPKAIVAAAPTDRYLWAIISAGSNSAGQLPSRRTRHALRG